MCWTTAPVVDSAIEEITFAFMGGLGWNSQPKTEGFELLVGDDVGLLFDVTRQSCRWTNENTGVELLYVPTWNSDEDSGGFFFVTLPKSRVMPGAPLKLGVRSRGEGSMRWFAVDYYLDAAVIARATLRP